MNAKETQQVSLYSVAQHLWSLVPSGGSLPDDVWHKRHRFMLGLTWFHAIIIALIGPVLGYSWDLTIKALFQDGTVIHAVGEGSIVALFAVLGAWKTRSRTFKATAIGFGLMSSSAILVHLSGGYIEFHFHFFVMLTFLALLQDWIPYGLAILFVAIHHGVVGVLWPEEVYNHTAAFNAPWTWAGIHAFFVLWASAGSIISWRFNEEASEETRRHLERIQAVRDLDETVSSTLELQPMLDLLLEKIELSFPDSVLIVRLVNDANGALEVAAWRNLTQEELRDVVQLNASGLSGVVLKSRQLLTINDVQADPRSLSLQTLQRHGLRSYLGVPLIAKDQALGTLSILTKEIYKFSTEEIEFISMLAGHAAVAIHNGQLHARLISLTSDLARSNKDLKRSEEVQRLLKDIAMAVSQSLNVSELLRVALGKVQEITGRERVYIRLKDMMTGDLSLAAQRGISEQYVGALLHHRTPGGKSDQVFESGKPLVVNDPEGTILKAETRDEGIRSIGFFPLKAQDKVIGILNVSTNKPIPFEPREVELLEAISNVVGVAVENARLYEETKRQEKIQKLLKELSQDITSLDISALFQKVTNKVREFFKVDISDIRLMGEGGSRPPVGASGIEAGRLYKAGGSRGRAGWIVRNRRPLVIPDTTKETTIPTGDSVRDLGIRGYLAVPLFSRSGEVIGILRALTYEPREFSQSEVDLLQQLASGTAIALENAHLLEETERRAQHLSALHSVATSASRSLELDTILKEVLEKIRDIFRFDVTQIYLVDPQAEELHLRAALDPRVSTGLNRKKKVFRFGEGNVGRVGQTGEPVVFEDVYNDPKYQEWSSTRVSYGSGYRFFAAFPIRAKSKTIGVLSGIGQSPRKLNEEEMRLLSSMTDQLGVCVENSQLYEDVKKHATALERSNKVKDEFLSVMSHELRTPLTAVIGYAGMLQDGFLGDVNQEQAKGLGVLLSQTNDLLTLINTILDVTKMEAGTMVVEKEKVDVKSFLDEIRSTYDTPRDKSLTLVWDYADHLPRVTTDGGKLKRILQNLVNNAIKFTDAGNVTISARVIGGPKGNGRQEEVSAQASHLRPHASESYVEFKVADTGIGIPRESLPVIFEKFRQVDSTETRAFGGVGLGLHIVKEFTEMLGGKIAVDSEPGRGSVFTVTIPLEPQA